MSATLRSADHLVLAAPPGLRFWDAVTARVIADGLRVGAYLQLPAGAGDRRYMAAPNRVGVYAFHDLPRRWVGEPAANAPRADLIIEVRDGLGRFQPFQLRVPLPAQGLVDWGGQAVSLPTALPMSLPEAPAPIPLFSSPTRVAPAGMGVIRATLYDPIARQPAAWAVLEAHHAGAPPVQGLADKDGQVALILAYPAPPAVGKPPPLDLQHWAVRLRAYYGPRAPAPELPDLRRALDQPAAALWAEVTRTHPLGEQMLVFGRELVVRSFDDWGNVLAEVLVTPA